jgi:hypothetical protein
MPAAGGLMVTLRSNAICCRCEVILEFPEKINGRTVARFFEAREAFVLSVEIDPFEFSFVTEKVPEGEALLLFLSPVDAHIEGAFRARPGKRYQVISASAVHPRMFLNTWPLACRIAATGYPQFYLRELFADRVERFTRPCAERHFACCAIVTVAVGEVHRHAAAPACMNLARESAAVPDGAALVGWLECSQDHFADGRVPPFLLLVPPHRSPQVDRDGTIVVRAGGRTVNM